MDALDTFFLTLVIDQVFGAAKGAKIMAYVPLILSAISSGGTVGLPSGTTSTGTQTPGSPLLLAILHQLLGTTKGDNFYASLSMVLEAIELGVVPGLSLPTSLAPTSLNTTALDLQTGANLNLTENPTEGAV
jgi:hypothetical protein